MRALPARFILAAALGVAAGTLPAQAAKIYEKTDYFLVRGSTLAELDRSLRRAGPSLARGGGRHPGATEVEFDGSIDYARGPENCRVEATNLELHLTMMLPRWQRTRQVPERVVVIWRTLAADIKLHEEKHAAIAKRWLTRMEMAIRNLAPERTCAAMEATVERVTRRYLAGHEQEQRRFDEVEGGEIAQRLRRSFDANLRYYGYER